jgi:hypothetical protein
VHAARVGDQAGHAGQQQAFKELGWHLKELGFPVAQRAALSGCAVEDIPFANTFDQLAFDALYQP